MRVRDRIYRAFLWASVLLWSSWVGARLFHMLVIVPTWNDALPDSLRTLYLDTAYGRNVGNFFGLPWMIARNLAVLAALIAGWHLRVPRQLLCFAVVCLGAVLGISVFALDPSNEVLFSKAGGELPMEEVRMLADQWILADQIQLGVGVLGLIAILTAFSVPVPPTLGRIDPQSEVESQAPAMNERV